jgi:IS605 OrfB family transposase
MQIHKESRKETLAFSRERNFGYSPNNAFLLGNPQSLRVIDECSMSIITYTAKLVPESQENLDALFKILEWQKFAFNEASKLHFGSPKNLINELHGKAYRKIRDLEPDMPSQVVIRAEHACLASYRTARSNKVTLKSPIVKKKLSMRLDKRLYRLKDDKPNSISITTALGRKSFDLLLYPKLQGLLAKYGKCRKDPELFVKDGKIFIAIPFEVEPQKEFTNGKLALGVDLGVRVVAACSDGRAIIDKKFNARRRKVRFLKRSLQSSGTKSARRHLKIIRRKERNQSKNQTHLIANEILRTKADTIVLENLKGIKGAKARKNRFQKKNRVSQVPFFELRQKLEYKAFLLGKRVVTVNPAYTSQTDSLTGKKEGARKGRRFYAKSGLIYDADLNAARNIGQLSKLPVSYGNILDGQAVVTQPIVLPNLRIGTSPRL